MRHPENFDSVDCQIEGLGRIEAVEDLYVEHTKAAIDSLGAADDAEAADDATLKQLTMQLQHENASSRWTLQQMMQQQTEDS